MKELATYEHPGDYVVIPLPVRDRIMARLTRVEARVVVLERGVKEHREAMLRSAGGDGRADHQLWLLLKEDT